MTTAQPTTTERSISSRRERIVGLDALRGFALCGILIVNIYQQVLGRVVPGQLSEVLNDAPLWVQWFFVGRFFPIFSVLFGVGFAIFLASAGRQTDHPRLVLARRLVFLALFGAVHWIFHPGEVLLFYALSGLIVLLPLSYLGNRAILAVAAVLLVAGAALVGHAGAIPGLIALGFGLGRVGLPRALDKAPARRVAILFGVVLLAAVLLAVPFFAQIPLPNVMLAKLTGAMWGIALAATYACAFVLLLRTPLGRPMSAAFAPMGRMALTNYLGATALMLLIGPAIGIDSYQDVGLIIALTVGINLAQMVASAVWLRYFRYGPMEWAWRCLTWWRVAPIR